MTLRLKGNGKAKAAPANVARVLARLNDVSAATKGWLATCPVRQHKKGAATLSIDAGDNGGVVVNCFAKCATEAVVKALGLTMADLAPPARTGRSIAHGRKKTEGTPPAPKPKRKPPRPKAPAAVKQCSSTDGATAATAVTAALLQADGEDAHLMEVARRTVRQMGEDPSKAAPFPLEVLPADLADHLRGTAAALPCPVDFVAQGTLATVSSFIGPDRPLEAKRGWAERAALYCGIVAQPGARKTPGLEKAMAPAWAKDAQLVQDHKGELIAYAKRKQQAKEEKKEFDEEPPKPRQHIATDTTIEAMAGVLTANPRGVLVYRDELTGWVASLNQYKGGKGSDRQFWLSAWSGQDYTVNRVGKAPVRITRPYLSVVGNLPPDMLGELADKKGREDGFVDRLLFAYPDPVPVVWTDTEPDEDLAKKYQEACLAIGELPAARLTLLSPAWSMPLSRGGRVE